MNFNEHNTLGYDWDDRGVYIIELSDYVEGGEDGVSNRQAKELTARTRNLHQRVATAEGEIDTLQEQTPIRVEAALASAKTYADGKDTVLRNDMAIADTSTLNTAKAYAEQVVAALVNGSPEALNTLQELAAALGGDPNFATTVMQAIGERMKSADVNAALASKADNGHVHSDLAKSAEVLALTGGAMIGDIVMKWGKEIRADNGSSLLGYSWEDRFGDVTILSSRTGGHTLKLGSNGSLAFDTHSLYHAGNLAPATPSAPGLMSKEDKTKLDGLSMRILASGKVRKDGGFDKKIGPFASQLDAPTPTSEGVYRINHNFRSLEYTTIVTPCERHGGVWSLSASVMSQYPSYVEIHITENEWLKNSSFNFMIVGTF